MNKNQEVFVLRENPHMTWWNSMFCQKKIDALLAALYLCRCKQGKTCFLFCFDKFMSANKDFLPANFIGGLKKTHI